MVPHLRWVLLLPLLGSCAFRTARSELFYPPHAPPAAVAVAAGLAPSEAVRVGAFEDRREERTWVGERRNSWGMHTTTIVSEDHVAPWVRSALTHELAREGIAASDTGTPVPEQRWTITGAIDTVFASEQFFSEGRVTLTAALAHDGKIVFRRSYQGVSSVPRSEGALDERCSEALALALADALRALVSDVRRALDA